jgi:glycosyltransferase involved in cell wall biosynthesis
MVKIINFLCNNFAVNAYYSPWSVLLYHFSVRSAFVHRSFTMRSSFVQRSFTVHKAFVHRLFTVRSAFVHRSFSVCSPFTKRSPFSVHKAFTVYSSHYHSELQWERIYFHREKMKAGRRCKSGRKIKYNYFHRYNTTKTAESHNFFFLQSDKTCWISSIAMTIQILLLIREPVIY